MSISSDIDVSSSVGDGRRLVCCPSTSQLVDREHYTASNTAVAEAVEERIDGRVAVRQRDADVVDPDRQHRVDVTRALHPEATEQRAVPEDDRQPADEKVADKYDEDA